jgi:hypothetical protein
VIPRGVLDRDPRHIALKLRRKGRANSWTAIGKDALDRAQARDGQNGAENLNVTHVTFTDLNRA